MTLFQEPKHKFLKGVVSLKSVPKARAAAKELCTKYKQAPTHAQKLEVLRATIEAGNRAEVISKNKNVSAPVRHREAMIEGTYRRASGYMSKELGKKYGK